MSELGPLGRPSPSKSTVFPAADTLSMQQVRLVVASAPATLRCRLGVAPVLMNAGGDVILPADVMLSAPVTTLVSVQLPLNCVPPLGGLCELPEMIDDVSVIACWQLTPPCKSLVGVLVPLPLRLTVLKLKLPFVELMCTPTPLVSVTMQLCMSQLLLLSKSAPSDVAPVKSVSET